MNVRESLTNVMADLDAKREYVRARVAEDPFPVGQTASVAVQREIETLGLTKNVLELDTQGYTVLTPEEVGSRELVPRMNEAIDRVAAKRAKGWTREEGLGTALFALLPEDRVFEEALLCPKPLALLTYLLGYHAKLSISGALLKGRATPVMRFHADALGRFPLPWPDYAQVANVTWMLSDYTAEGGPLCFVPGSHRLSQPPPGYPENPITPANYPGAVPVEGPAGSVVVWHGNLWHGAKAREIDGLRRTMVYFFVRSYIEAQEIHKFKTTLEMLKRNPARFGVLVGLTEHIPWADEGPRGEPSFPDYGGMTYPVTGTYLHE